MDGGKDVESVVVSGNRNLCCHLEISIEVLQ